MLAGRLVLGSIVGAAPDAVPPDWRFYAGGGGSVRGYPFQSIGPRTASGTPAGGDGLLEAGLELRQRFGANWGAVAFADAGAVSESGIPGTRCPLGRGRDRAALFHAHRAGAGRHRHARSTSNDGDAPCRSIIGIGRRFLAMRTDSCVASLRYC